MAINRDVMSLDSKKKEMFRIMLEDAVRVKISGQALLSKKEDYKNQISVPKMNDNNK